MPSNERTPAFRKASEGEPQIGRVEGSGIIPRHSDIEMIVVWRGPTACGPFADQREIAELADMHGKVERGEVDLFKTAEGK